MKRLKAEGIEVIVYEPFLQANYFFRSVVIKNLAEFKERSDLIITNRRTQDLDDVYAKIYTRDIFGKDS